MAWRPASWADAAGIDRQSNCGSQIGELTSMFFGGIDEPMEVGDRAPDAMQVPIDEYT